MSNVKEKEWYDNLVDFAVDSLSGEDVCRYYDIFPIGCSFQEYCKAIKKVLMNCGYRYDDKSAEKLIKDDIQWIENNYIKNVPPSDVAIDIGYCCG